MTHPLPPAERRVRWAGKPGKPAPHPGYCSTNKTFNTLYSAHEVAELAATVAPELGHLDYAALDDLSYEELDAFQHTLAAARRVFRLLGASMSAGSETDPVNEHAGDSALIESV